MVNAALKKAGFPARRTGQITSRWYYLTHRAGRPTGAPRASEIERLAARRTHLLNEIDRLDRKRDSLIHEEIEVRYAMQAEVGRIAGGAVDPAAQAPAGRRSG